MNWFGFWSRRLDGAGILLVVFGTSLELFNQAGEFFRFLILF